MKKLFAILMVALMVVSMTTVVSAANTTTLTTTVPAASYTLNIPADQTIPFGTEKIDIGNVTVTDSAGFAEGKNLKVTVTYEDFACSAVTTTIPYVLQPVMGLGTNIGSALKSGDFITFMGQNTGEVAEQAKVSANDMDGLCFVADSEDWGKALAGEYTSTITFTAEVVAE